ncbi:MAG: hypothetical protein A2Y95_04640 [Deltaproteobacteria bacterium RBG_13_65_10]|nr:MAG: hypothetical protein A2Y95_04640 [Deltaproteobacteria bacterium RBG_13_65_10]
MPSFARRRFLRFIGRCRSASILWGTYPMRAGFSQRTIPSCGRIPRIAFKRTVLPDPFGPRIARISPSSTSKETRSRMVFPSRTTLRSFTERIFTRGSLDASVKWSTRGTGFPRRAIIA